MPRRRCRRPPGLAAKLGCAEVTVELHVSALFRAHEAPPPPFGYALAEKRLGENPMRVTIRKGA